MIMFKRTVLPTIIGIMASAVYIASCLIIPGIVILIISTVPALGTILNFLMRLMFLNVSALDLFYAAASAMLAILFIFICTKYDKYDEYNAASTSSGIAATVITIILIAATVFVIHEGQPVFESICGIFPFFISGIMVARGLE